MIAIISATAIVGYRMRASAAVPSPGPGFHALIQVREAGARLWRSVFSGPLAGTITGTVFQDYNSNGVLDTSATFNNNGSGTIGLAADLGVANVTVTATCVTALGADGVIGTADDTVITYPSVLSDSSGNYSIATTGAIVNSQACRVVFTNLAAGYLYGPRGTSLGAATQFVADNASNVNLGLVYPDDFCQNNPDVITPCYVFGNQISGANSADVVLLSSPYSAGALFTDATAANHDQPTTHSFTMPASAVGTTHGVAYGRTTNRVFSSAYFKRHSGFGAGLDGTIDTTDDPGAIYVVNRASSTVVATFTVPSATTNAHNPANYLRDNDNIGFNAVGKTSLGGLALSDDESRLYVMNLENRTLYALNSTTGAVLTSQAVPTSPPLLSPSPVGTCNPADVRPFAVKMIRGVLYVGMVCSAESATTVDTFTDANANSQFDPGEAFVDNDGNGVYNLRDARQLQGYVYTVDPTTLAFSAAPAFQFLLNYPRGLTNVQADAFGEWRPWTPTFARVRSNVLTGSSYPQPMLTDIDLDRSGNLILGLRDRFGDQMGNNAQSDPNNPSTLLVGFAAGDTLKACANGAGWTLESNGRCGGQGTGPQNNGYGPENPTGGNAGSAEFYFQDFYISVSLRHDDVSMGGLLQVPGFPNVLTTAYEPLPSLIASQTQDGGFRWFHNTTGDASKDYRVYNDVNGGSTFGKSNGLGALVATCNSAPVEIGDRIWMDSNRNGVQDPGETSLANVTVRLYQMNGGIGTLLATALTDANGNYVFSNDPRGYAVAGNATPNATSGGGVTGGFVNDNQGGRTSTAASKYGILGIQSGLNYEIRLDNPTDYTTGNPLFAKSVTEQDDAVASPGGSDLTDSDAALVTNPNGSPAGTFPVVAVAIPAASFGANTHTFDIGLQLVSDLGITKTVSQPTYVQGAATNVTYTVVVTNNGPSDVTGASVSDLQPANVSFNSWTCSATGGTGSVTNACGAASGSGNIATTVTLRNGATATFSISATIGTGATGTVTNTANEILPANIIQGTPNATDTASVNVTPVSVADLGITKTVSQPTYTQGAATNVTYTVVVTNNGPSDVTAAPVSDSQPANVTFNSWTCTAAGGTGSVTNACGAASGSGNIATTVTLRNGATATFSISATIGAGATGTVTNRANETLPAGVTQGGTNATDTASVNVTPVSVIDLGITKTVSQPTYTQGAATNVTYTVVVTNNGPSDVTAAPVSDAQPANVTFNSWTCSATGGTGSVTNACGAASGTGNIATTVTLRNGATATFSISATIGAGATGTVTNTASETLPGGVTQGTPNAADTASVNVTPVSVIDLGITKTVSQPTYTQGVATNVTYTVVVTNNGPSDVTAAPVTDAQPANVTFNSWTCNATGGTGSVTNACGAASGSGNIATTVTLRNGATATFSISATIGTGATGTVTNTASESLPAGVTQGAPNAADTASVNVTPVSVADLGITKSATPLTYTQGAATGVTYTVVVTNNGPSLVTAAPVSDTQPANVTFNSWTCATAGGTGTGTNACGAATGLGNITTTVTLRNGATATFTINATIGAAATGTVTNTASETLPAGVTQGGTNAADSASASVTPTSVADLTITKTANPLTYTQGASTNVTYTVAVTNNGPSLVTSAPVTDTAPANVTFSSWTCATSGGTGTGTNACGAASGTGNIATTVTLRNGATATYTISATIGAAATGTVTNTASETLPAGVTQGGTNGPDTASVNVTPTSVVDLGITKSVTPLTYTQGASTNVTYTAVVTNNGPSDVTAAPVTDSAPANVTFNSWTCAATGGTGSVTNACGAASGTGNIATTVTLRNGATATFTINATVGTGATGTVTNTASETLPAGVTQGTPNAVDTASASVTPTSTADLGITKTASQPTYTQGAATNVTYTVVVTNNGPSIVTAANVTDAAPSGVTFNSWTCAAAGGTGSGSNACGAASGTGNIATTVTLRNGATATFTIDATIGAAASGTITNTASETLPAGVAQGTPNAPDTASAIITGQTYALGNRVWLDLNNSGTIDAADGATPGLDGVVVRLLNAGTLTTANDANGNPVADLTTSGGGYYRFDNLAAGDYVVEVVAANFSGTGALVGAISSSVDAGDPDTDLDDSDDNGVGLTPDPTNGIRSAAITLGPGLGSEPTTEADLSVSDPAEPNGQTNLTVDFGFTPTADLGIVKSVAPLTYVMGTTTGVTYTVVVTNNGPSDVTAASVADTAPAGVTFNSWTCAATGGTGSVTNACGAASGTGNIATTVTLRNGATATFTIDATVGASATGTITNTASETLPSDVVQGTPNAPDADTADITPVSVADLGVTKVVNPVSYTQGVATNVTYTVVVTNNGPSDVTNANVTDAAPANITFNNWTCTATGGTGLVTNACGAATGSGDIATTVTLRNGATATFSIDATIGTGATGTITNTATETLPGGVTQGPTNAPDTATAVVTSGAVADLGIVKSATPTIYPTGAATNVTYTVVVTNNGPSDVTGAAVTDAAPANVTFNSWSCTAAGGTGSVTNACGAASGTGNIATTVTLQNGATATFTINATIGAAAFGAITNVASETLPAGVAQAPSNAPDTATAIVTSQDYALGNRVWRDLNNSGTIDAADGATPGIDGVIMRLLNAGTLTPATHSNGDPVTDQLTSGGGYYRFDNLAAGDYVVEIIAANFTGVGVLADSVSSSPDAGDPDVDIDDSDDNGVGTTPDPTNGIRSAAATLGPALNSEPTTEADLSATDPVEPNGQTNLTVDFGFTPVADLAIVKSVAPLTYTLGATTGVTYTVVVTNNGPADVTNANVVDAAPAGVTFNSWACAAAGGVGSVTNACGATAGTGNIATTVTLRNGATATFTIDATVGPAATGTITNTANETLPPDVTQGTPNAPDAATADLTPVSVADLGVTKTVTPLFYTQGAATNVTYTVVVTNNGPSDVTGASVTDAAPANVTFNSWTCTATGGTGFVTNACGAPTGTGSIATTVTLRSGATATFSIDATIGAAATGVISNTVTETLPGGVTQGATNAPDTATADVTPTVVADLGIVKSVTPLIYVSGVATNATYTVVVTNNGPADVTGANVLDAAPTGVTFNSWTCTAAGGSGTVTNACGAASGTGDIATSLTLQNGATATFVIDATIEAFASGAITNTASESLPVGVIQAPTNAPDSASAVVTGQTYALGNRVWRDLNNNGVIDAADGATPGIDGVVVRLLDAATLTRANDANGNQATDQTTANGGYYRFDNLPAGDYIVEVIAANFTSPGVLAGTVSSAADAGDPDTDVDDSDDNGVGTTPDPTNGIRSAAVTLGPALNSEPTTEADLSTTDPTEPNGQTNLTVDFGFATLADLGVTKTVNPVSYTQGAATNVTYTVIVTNNGPSDVTGASVVDAAPANITFNNWTCTAAGGTGVVTNACGAPTGTGNVATTVTLRNGATATFLIDATIGVAASGLITNTVTETLPAGLTQGPTNAPDIATADVTSGAVADLGIVKSVLPATYAAGVATSVTYTVVVTNNGPSDVTAASVADTAPAGVTFNNWTCAAAGGTGLVTNACGAPAGTGNIATTVTLRNGATATFSIDATISAAAIGSITNTASETLPAGVAQGPTNAPDTATAVVASQVYALGNRVWRDLNNSGTIDGPDGATPGIDGVILRLLNAGTLTPANDAGGNPVANQTTANGGYYRFDNLAAGDYVVEITASNFTGAGVLVSTISSSPDAGDPDLDVDDSDDNGVGTTPDATNGIRAAAVTLGPTVNSEPTTEADLSATDPVEPNGQTNLTVDFGFVPTFSLGNRVWKDVNNSGTIDAIDGPTPGIDGVVVRLINAGTLAPATDAAGAPVPDRTTSGGGYYRFDNLLAGDYIVQVPALNFTGAGSLTGFVSSTGGDDPDTDVDDSDDNGVGVAPSPADGTSSFPVTLGPAVGSEPTNETDLGPGDPVEPNGMTNLTVDFGFTPIFSLGNRVWKDLNSSGTIDVADGPAPGVDGVTVNLYQDTNNDNLPDGPAIQTTATAGGGYYRFDNLYPGGYIVEIPATNFIGGAPLTSYVSATPDATNPNNDTDSDDNGLGIAPGPNGIRSNTLILGPDAGTEPGNDNDPVTNPGPGEAPNGLSNRTVDFAFVPVFSLGNRVWFDTDNSGTLNNAEVGVNGVIVRLLRSDGVTPATDANGTPVADQITTGGGYYQFDNLPAGDYIVEIVAANFSTGAVLNGYVSSSVEVANPNTDLDNDDNGVGSIPSATTGIRSGVVTLGPDGNTEPTGDNDPATNPLPGEAINGSSNRTVDFGFYRLILSGQIWNDLNNNGLLDGGEPLLPGLSVELLDSTATVIRTTTTQANGGFEFSGLPAGDYSVRATQPAGYFSSTGGPGATGPYEPGPDPDNDVDNDDNGSNEGGQIPRVISSQITLTAGAEPTVDNPTGTSTNSRLDLGVLEAVDLGITKNHTDPAISIGSIFDYTLRVTNVGSSATTGVITVIDALPAGLAYRSTTASGWNCGAVGQVVTCTTPGPMAPGATSVILLNVSVRDSAPPNILNTASVNVQNDLNPTNNVATDIAVIGTGIGVPGGVVPGGSQSSDQKPGSILIYPVYTSDPTDPSKENTRISLTNIDPRNSVCMHLFFIDGSSCSVADSIVCLTPNQTTTFLTSDIDPGVRGYIVAIAVDESGCPTGFNRVLGESYVKMANGAAGSLPAESYAALYNGTLPGCDANSTTATVNLDGIQYNLTGKTLASSNITSMVEGNTQFVALARTGGDLTASAGSLGNLFGVFYNDLEIGVSFTISAQTCMFRQALSNSFPRTTPRLSNFIEAGHTGWFKVSMNGSGGMVGAIFNTNPNTSISESAFNGGHVMHKLTLTTDSFTIPIFPAGR